MVGVDMKGEALVSAGVQAHGITARDLLRSRGAFWIDGLESLDDGGLLFGVRGRGYEFAAGIKDDLVFIARNDILCTARTPRPGRVMFGWTPDALHLRVRDGSFSTPTPFATPPLAMIRDIRLAGLLPTTAYASEGDFRSEVVEMLQDIQHKITDVGSVDAFWNLTRDGQRIVERRPKTEPEIQPIIQQLLVDRALARGVDIAREPQTAGGALDFLFTGSLANNQGLVRVPVEAKLAHSDDLIKGRSKQLPTYARSLGCSFGVYLVLWFKGLDWDRPGDASMAAMTLRLQLHPDNPKDVLLRDVPLDLSRQPPPSA